MAYKDPSQGQSKDHTSEINPIETNGLGRTSLEEIPWDTSISDAHEATEVEDNPLQYLELTELDRNVREVYQKYFKDKRSATEEELLVGVRLARDYANHKQVGADEESSESHKSRNFTPSLDEETVVSVLRPYDWAAIKVQQSRKFWKEPKALIVTLVTCCVGAMTQGWAQAANGNLDWPSAVNLRVNANGTGRNMWHFASINSTMWFAAAVIGPLLLNQVSYATRFGRRGSILIAAGFSLAGSIGGSRSTKWWSFLIWRGVLGIGIGAKASIVPVWQSEILPHAKRGRVLVSWQVFIATGLFGGSVATYVLRSDWRAQVLSGALPALILLVMAYLGCESPRWLVIRGEHVKAFDTLIRLRQERYLAAEEFCYIYFQTQWDRAKARGEKKPDFGTHQPHMSLLSRLGALREKRNRRAAIATVIVMTAQHLSGINIFAFFSTIFFNDSKLDLSLAPDTDLDTRLRKNLQMSIAFAAANAIFSTVAYFLIEPLPPNMSISDLARPEATTGNGTSEKSQKRRQRLMRLRLALHGRRKLMLQSLGSGAVVLAVITSLLQGLPPNNISRLGVVTFFVFLFAACYAPGAGAVPFLYSAEVWPNEARDVGMSLGVFVNFVGAGLITMFVPLGLDWNSVKLLGIFSGTSSFGFLLVYFFVPGIEEAKSLEEMSKIFQGKLSDHATRKAKQLIPHWRRHTRDA